MTKPVAEIVTFDLAEDVTAEDFMAVSKPSEGFVQRQPGFVRRQLSMGEDGRWTDYVLWADMAAAKAAMQAFMEQDFAPAMMAAIAPDSVIMRHEAVLWDMAVA